jgi:hypothetical protein
MSPIEYEQLVEFLGHLITQIDERFDQVDGIAESRREMLSRFDEIDRRIEGLETGAAAFNTPSEPFAPGRRGSSLVWQRTPINNEPLGRRWRQPSVLRPICKF